MIPDHAADCFRRIHVVQTFDREFRAWGQNPRCRRGLRAAALPSAAQESWPLDNRSPPPEEIKSLCGSLRQGLICGHAAALRMEIVNLRADLLETSSSRQVSSNTGISSCSVTRGSFGVTAKTKRAVDCRPVDTENLRDLFDRHFGIGPIENTAITCRAVAECGSVDSKVPRRPATVGISRMREPTTGLAAATGRLNKILRPQNRGAVIQTFVRARMIPDHCGFPMGSDFQSDRPLTMRTAIVTANWRGCEGMSPLHVELSRRGGTAGRAWARRLL
jgi:hypothetical protein